MAVKSNCPIAAERSRIGLRIVAAAARREDGECGKNKCNGNPPQWCLPWEVLADLEKRQSTLVNVTRVLQVHEFSMKTRRALLGADQ